jgi:hypothetical protein
MVLKNTLARFGLVDTVNSGDAIYSTDAIRDTFQHVHNVV